MVSESSYPVHIYNMPNLLFGPSFLCSFDNLRIELLGTVFLNYSVRPTLSPVIAIVVAITSVCGFMFFSCPVCFGLALCFTFMVPLFYNHA